MLHAKQRQVVKESSCIAFTIHPNNKEGVPAHYQAKMKKKIISS
ncbi:hypothetical protein QG37_03319 [Candidozyma auris]|nr:hypothetical protein QG37_03319 [[Candida] auris]